MRLLDSSSLSVRPSAWNSRLSLDGFSFEFDILGFFSNSVEEIQVSLSSHKNSGHFTWRRLYICDNILLNFS